MIYMNMLIACAIFGYLLGTIPFGLVLTRLAGFGDIRKVGSGNIGATNVLRATGRKDLTLITIILDASKAAIAAAIAYSIVPEADIVLFVHVQTTTNIIAGLLTGSFAVIGHNFPVWLKFKGGKGVASAFGLVLLYTPYVALLALLTWITVAIVTRYSSLAAITAAFLLPVYTFIFEDSVYLYFYIPLVALVLIRHHTNFKRLFKGEESKITFKKAN